MKKIILILVIVALVCLFTACDENGTLRTTMSAFEQRVIEAACNELDVDTNGATLTLVSSEYVAWLGCDVNSYILTLADGSQWLVGARENADGFYCDVEAEI